MSKFQAKLKMRRNSTVYTVLRSMRQPTKLDEVINSVRKPKGAVPNFGLPKWKAIPLEWKIPLVPWPEENYFSRKKIGKKLYTSSKNVDFDLTDPNNYEIAFAYNSLHDRHLARYFSNEKNVWRLKELGFITDNLDAKCSVKEYNMYRKYLRKVHGDGVRKELRRREEEGMERRDLKIANAEAQMKITKLKSNEKNLKMQNKLREQAAEKHRQQLKKQKQIEERLKMRESEKRDQKKRTIQRAKLRAEHSKRRRRLVKERERQRIVKLLLNCQRKNREKEKTHNKCLREAEEARREANEKKWMEREIYQEWLLTIEKFILEYAEGEAKRNIKKYMKNVEGQRERMRRNIENYSKYLRCFKMRHGTRPEVSCCEIDSRPKKLDEIMHFSESMRYQEPEVDQCEMTERCRCHLGSEFCMDLRQLHV